MTGGCPCLDVPPQDLPQEEPPRGPDEGHRHAQSAGRPPEDHECTQH